MDTAGLPPAAEGSRATDGTSSTDSAGTNAATQDSSNAPSTATNTLSFRLVRAATTTATPSLDDDFAELRTRCQRMGHVRSAVIFKTHRRATVVFDTDDEAALARRNLHQFQLPSGTIVHAFWAKPTPLLPRQPHLLEVPMVHHNLFLSPPPSPPEGWQPTLEPSPSRDWAAHAAAVEAQLRQYSVFEGTDELPSIVVEDMDFDDRAVPPEAVVDVDPESMPHRSLQQTRRPPLRVAG